jgi:hypothetical protein
MHEYDATRNDIGISRSNQTSVLSFGAAAVGLLVAAAAGLWENAVSLAGLLLLIIVPVVCFLTIAIYAGELTQLMRSRLYLHELENWVNESTNQDKPVLAWEGYTTIRRVGADVESYNRRTIPTVFGLFAFCFTIAGYLRLHSASEIQERWATSGLICSLLLSLLSIVYAKLFFDFARQCQVHYTAPAKAQRLNGY